MALASTSRVQLSYIEELVFGVTPDTGTVRKLRMTGESLNFTLNKESSSEVNDTRSVSSMVAVSAEASGGVQGEMQYAEYDPLIAATLQGSWTTTGGTPFSATIVDDTITAAVAPVGPDAFTNLQLGQWISFKAIGENSSKLLRVSTTVPPTSTIITLDAGTPVLPGTFPAAALVTSRLTNGVDQKSFSFQREIGDVGEFFLFRGMTPSSMTLNISSGAISTIEFSFMGRDSLQDDAPFMPSAAVDSQTYQIMSGVSGTTCALWVNGAPLVGTFINSIALTYDNTLRQQTALCALGAIGIGSGQINCTVDLEVYFAAGATFYQEFLDNTNIEVAFTSYDAEGNGYIFTLPAANVSSYSVNASGGSDSDLMATISLTALRDASNSDAALRKVIFIDRIGGPVV